MKILARAKINLTLYVTRKRTDGYHDLELIFQPVSLADELDIRENGSDQLRFSCSVKEFENEDNLVCRGYRAMRRRFPGKVRGLDIHLTKKIPSGAGMGGGSTDCSALLAWMNEHFGLGLSRRELIAQGAALGADVPACLIPHATLGQGIGEMLTDIRVPREYPLLILKPDLSFPTGEMYRRVDEAEQEWKKSGNLPGWNVSVNEIMGCAGRSPAGLAAQIPNNAGMIRAMERGDLRGIASRLENVFEMAVPEQDRIRDLKARLTGAGALGSLMTGSGSAVYGIFEDPAARDSAFLTLRNLPGCLVIPCEAVNRYGEGGKVLVSE